VEPVWRYDRLLKIYRSQKMARIKADGPDRALEAPGWLNPASVGRSQSI
jgi:hypothetical protein